jgi:4-hydroxythreonine-4-phosphate dehydrogenase
MKKLAITMGDPGGIGPEIIVKALGSSAVKKLCVPIIIGNALVMEAAMKLLKSSLRLRIIKSPEDSKPAKGIIELIHVPPPTSPLQGGGIMSEIGKVRRGCASRLAGEGGFEINRPTAEGGKACSRYIKQAVAFAMKQEVEAIVTAPISKEALNMAGLPWPGHTEMLAQLTKTREYAMMFVGGPLRIMLVTIHEAIKNIPEMIKKKNVYQTIRLAKSACKMLRIRRPRIAVCGLNPHAGEAGMFGDEEADEIIPAIKKAVKNGIPVSGPYPPDTIFHKAYHGKCDIVICMYHDQGLVPLKMIAFDTGVNVTVGLPFIRTSPDHGTAYDIAWKGTANPSSMIEAIKLAALLAKSVSAA